MQTKAEHGSNYEIKQRNQKREARNLGMKHKNLRRRNTEPGRWRNSAGDTQLKRRRDADEPATNRKTQLTLIRAYPYTHRDTEGMENRRDTV